MNENGRYEVFQLQAEFCKSLADAKRLMIVHELRDGEKSVGEVADKLGLKQSNTSQHLATLRRAGVITSRRQGNTVFYSLANERIGEACDMVRSFILDQIQNSQDLVKMM